MSSSNLFFKGSRFRYRYGHTTYEKQVGCRRAGCMYWIGVQCVKLTFLSNCFSQWKGCKRGNGAKCQNQERPTRDTQVPLFVKCPRRTLTCRIPLIRAHVCCSGLAWCQAEAVRPSPTAPVPPACPGLDGEPCTSPSWRVRRKVETTEKCYRCLFCPYGHLLCGFGYSSC